MTLKPPGQAASSTALRSGNSVRTKRSVELRINAPCYGNKRYGVTIRPLFGGDRYVIELLEVNVEASANPRVVVGNLIRAMTTGDSHRAILEAGILMAHSNPAGYCKEVATKEGRGEDVEIIPLTKASSSFTTADLST